MRGRALLRVLLVTAGDRVAYTARFVRDAGGGLHETGARRGTVIRLDPPLVYVRWDDEDLTGYDADPELRDFVRDHGQPVHLANVCKVGSVRFADPGARGMP